jgi:predicted Zn-dependent peptidase
VDREIERLKAEGPALREIERARNKVETSFWRGLEGLGERADRLNRYQFHFADPGAIGKDRARYDAVTGETAARWAREVLRQDERLILRVVPKG